jgi:hypothetical protein
MKGKDIMEKQISITWEAQKYADLLHVFHKYMSQDARFFYKDGMGEELNDLLFRINEFLSSVKSAYELDGWVKKTRDINDALRFFNGKENRIKWPLHLLNRLMEVLLEINLYPLKRKLS